MGYFFYYKGPIKPNLLPDSEDFSSFLKICVQFQDLEIYTKEAEKHEEI